MSPLVALVGAGTLTGLGVALVIVGLAGRGHPVLVDALDALDERVVRPADPVAQGRSRRLLLPLLRQLPGAVPDRDLELLGWTRDRFLVARTVAAVRYAATGPALAAAVAVLDLGLPVAVPTGFALAGAVVGWTGCGRRIEQQSERAREELRFALVSYLQQVSLLRRGGAGVATALQAPARLLDDSWAMRRIGAELALAERAGEMPWDGLRRFADRIGVTELADLSSIAATAGRDGGAVVDTLMARAESLRDELLADAHAEANRTSARMSTPAAVQVFLISAWVLFPAGTALLTY